MIFSGEGNVDIKFVADAVPHDLLFKTGNKLTGTQFQTMSLGSAPLKFFTVNRTGIIHGHRILQLCGTIGHFNIAGISLAGIIHILVHFVLRDFADHFFGNQTLILFQFYHRLGEIFHFDGNAFLVDISNFDIGCADHFHAAVGHGGSQGIGEQIVEGIFIKYALAVVFFNDTLGSFSFAEARYADLANHAFIYVHHSRIKIGFFDQNFQFSHVLFGFIDIL